MRKMETITDKETGKIDFILRGVDIGKDVTEQASSKRIPDASLISISALKALVADTESYSDFVDAINAL